MNQFIDNQSADFQKAIDFFIKDIASLRTGRASAGLLDRRAGEHEADAAAVFMGRKCDLAALRQDAAGESRSLVIDVDDDRVAGPVQMDVDRLVRGAGRVVQQVEDGLFKARVGKYARCRLGTRRLKPALRMGAQGMPALAHGSEPAVGRLDAGVFEPFGTGAPRQAGDDFLAGGDLLAQEGDVFARCFRQLRVAG